MIGYGLNGRRHQNGQSRPSAFESEERRLRLETQVDCDRGAVLQGWCGLDVEAADMEEGQDGEDMIVGSEAVHVLAHYSVPQ